MFASVQQYSLDSLSFQQKFSQHFELFQDTLHHALLLTITGKDTSISLERSSDYGKQFKMFLESSRSKSDEKSLFYIEFLRFLEDTLRTKTDFSHRKELIP